MAFAPAAQAACTGPPTGNAGDIINNAAYNVLQYCDGTNWIAMEPKSASSVITNDQSAIDALGQFASTVSDATVVYTTSAVNNNKGSVNALGFSSIPYGGYPDGVALDAVNHRLFVSDFTNNRVLEYNLNSDNSIPASPGHTATHVLGQANFTSSGYATTQAGMWAPQGLAFDATNNRLFVTDDNNARVLVYNTATITDGMNAAYVLGQPGWTASSPNCAAALMDDPSGLAYDAVHNRLFVSEKQCNRVTVFLLSGISNGMPASYVLGPPGGLSDNTSGTSQSLLAGPDGIAYDASNDRLFVSDWGNNRVMVFSTATITNGENASYVLGQSSWAGNTLAHTQAGMFNPVDVAFDATNNRLFVADTGNNRVLVFNVATGTIANGENAANVLGQSSWTGNGAVTTQAGLNYPAGLAFNATAGSLFVGDSGNNRVTEFFFGGGSSCSPEGTLMYNNDYHLYQFCDGTNWEPMGPTSAGGGGGCTGDGLVGWWKLDDGSSGTTPTTAADSSGNGNTGTNVSSPTWGAGKIGNALTFNGTTQEVTVPDVAALQLAGSWTASTWVKFPSLPASGSAYGLLAKLGSGGNENYSLWLDNGQMAFGSLSGLHFVAHFATTGGVDKFVPYTPGTISSGIWYLVTGTWDGTTLSIYVNGMLGASTAPGTVPATGSGLGLIIGNDHTSADWYTNATFDDVRVYNRALRASEIAALYNLTNNEAAMFYDGTNNVMQYCNGTNWVGIGK